MRTTPAARRPVLLSLLLGIAAAHAAEPLATEDARLNRLYRQRVAQLANDAAALAKLRSGERDWIRQRDSQCGKETPCLADNTKARADWLQTQVNQDDPDYRAATPVPPELVGTWTVSRIVPTQTVACWDDKQAKALVGTTIVYEPGALRWKNVSLRNQGVTRTVVEAQAFAEDHAGSASSLDFATLGIATPSVVQFDIAHADTAAGDETPGDTVLVKDANTLVFAVCNVWFEARREAPVAR